jgi:hypothetical protein
LRATSQNSVYGPWGACPATAPESLFNAEKS